MSSDSIMSITQTLMEINHACKNIHYAVFTNEEFSFDDFSNVMKNGITSWSETIIQEVEEKELQNESDINDMDESDIIDYLENVHSWDPNDYELMTYDEHKKILKKEIAKMTQSHECETMTRNEKWSDEKAENEKLKAENVKLKEQLAISKCDDDSDSEEEWDGEEIECDECCKGISYDECVHITEDEHLCKGCGVDADGKVIPDICIECYKRPCKCDSESDDDFEKDKCEAKELIEQMKKNGHIGIIVDEQAGMNPNVRSLFTKEDIRQAELKKMALNGELKELLSKHDFKLVSDPNKGKQSEIAIFK